MITFIIFLGIVFAITFVILKSSKNKNNGNGKALSGMPGAISVPLLGTTYMFLFDDLPAGFRKYHRECKKAYPGPMRSVLGAHETINIFKDVHFEEVMSSQSLITKGITYKFLYPWLGTGLLTSTGQKWHSRRKLITPAFHFNILDVFSDIFFEKTSLFIDILKKLPEGEVIDIMPYITNCALDIICETAMGVQVKAQEDHENQYVAAIHGISKHITDRILRPWWHADSLWKLFSTNYQKHQKCLEKLHRFTNTVIKERREEFESNPDAFQIREDAVGRKRRLAFLDLLLQATEDGKPLSNEDIREEVDTFMFEGHDTTAAAINWAISTLGNHPEVQEKIHQEFESILQGSDRPFTKNDLSKMKYLEMVIKETLRLYPSVPVTGRLIQEDSVVCDYYCPKNTLISLNIFQLHRDPANFPDPEKFDPERFSPEESSKRHPYAYVPFSAGPRNCIGQKFAMMEEKVILSAVLRNFKIVSHVKQEELGPVGTLILRMEKDCKITLIPRK